MVETKSELKSVNVDAKEEAVRQMIGEITEKIGDTAFNKESAADNDGAAYTGGINASSTVSDPEDEDFVADNEGFDVEDVAMIMEMDNETLELENEISLTESRIRDVEDDTREAEKNTVAEKKAIKKYKVMSVVVGALCVIAVVARYIAW